MVHRRLIMLVLSASAFNGQNTPEARNIDFRNFTFPFPPDAALGLPVPDDVRWMDKNLKTTVTLVNGRCDFNERDPSAGPSVTLDEVHYGYLTMSGQLDAMVVLGYHTGGTANWNYVYAFSLAFGVPKLLLSFAKYGDRQRRPRADRHSSCVGVRAAWDGEASHRILRNSIGWFRTGARAASGLYDLVVTNGEFILDVFDPREREADCCSAGFIRTRYIWRNGKFAPDGPPRFGHVPEAPTPR